MVPLHLIVACLVGWVHREQQEVVEYLHEENRILRPQLHGKQLQLTDDDRRRWQLSGSVSAVGS